MGLFVYLNSLVLNLESEYLLFKFDPYNPDLVHLVLGICLLDFGS